MADGPLTSRLQHLQPGDPIIVSRKPTGTLVLRDLKPGKRLFMFATGTGLAPFMSLIHDPETYERFEKVVLIHGVRRTSELAYRDYIEHDIARPRVLRRVGAREADLLPDRDARAVPNEGRLTDLIESGKLFADIDQPPLDPATDRAMICGSPAMLADTAALLDARGFKMPATTPANWATT